MNTSLPNFSIVLKPSRALFIIFVFLHGLAVVSLLTLSISVWLKIIAIIFTLVVGVRTTTQYALLETNTAVVKVGTASAANRCQIETKNGKTYQANLKNAGWLFGYFAVLVLSTNTHVLKTIIAKDAISQEQFYTLSLYLRSINCLR